MSIVQKQFEGDYSFSAAYERVRAFLLRINSPRVTQDGFLWGRWEWMFSLRFADESDLRRIAIWEDSGKIVGVATFEEHPGDAYLLLDPAYPKLRGEMLQYAGEHLRQDGTLRVIIDERDAALQEEAFCRGYRPTQDMENNAMIPLEGYTWAYALPAGFRIVSLAEDGDIRKYNHVLWRGFNHPGIPPQDDKWLEERRISLSGPHVKPTLNIAVAEPGGMFVAYCGMWYEPGTDYALVEPVATDPDYRKMGLGKAAVLEAVSRCARLGAKRAYVGSSQQFYYRIGFRPCSTKNWWVKNWQAEK